MSSRISASSRSRRPIDYRAIFPEDADQGDPYLLDLGDEFDAPFRYYVYVTSGATPPDAFPVYASSDLVEWRKLGHALQTDQVPRAYWAPCVRHVPGLPRPFVMLYSRSIGIGTEAHIGHLIHRADSERPEGPFVDSGEVLTPDTDFAIDPDVYRAADGSLRLAYATDFVSDAPLGTGIVEVAITDDLRGTIGEPRVLARASEPWHLYEAERRMPWKQVPGVDWTTETVRWHTVEAPVGGLVSPSGRRVYLYSGGCYFGFYGVGALVEDEAGALHNVTREGSRFVLGPDPERRLFAPGHCSWFRADDGRDYLIAHARLGSPNAPRNAMLVALEWDEDGVPYCTRMPASSR